MYIVVRSREKYICITIVFLEGGEEPKRISVSDLATRFTENTQSQANGEFAIDV